MRDRTHEGPTMPGKRERMNHEGNRLLAISRGLLGCCLILAISGCEVDQEKLAEENHRAQIERGEYLVTTGACDDCHTPWIMGENGPEPDMTRRLSGHPASFVISAAPEFDSPEWS
ncbi:MAG: hypothetical protein R3338_12395, partial [Thermoanaerobaculia bacterium]|nr:hypothetical protein [Thermoanaerobaculia bacterium]